MTSDFNDIKTLWKNNKQHIQSKTVQDTEAIIEQATKKKNRTLRIQLGNITILLGVLLIISLYFVYVAKFQQSFSHLGSLLMIGSLALRVLIEIFSICFNQKIDLTATVNSNNNSFLRYYSFRKKIHGPVTIGVVLLYSIGFYMLTPEFATWFPLWLLVLIDLSYVLGAFIAGYFVRSAIVRELKMLKEILRFRDDLKQ
ncbi:hypothetical protein [uncultured Draconibacterium sp.]|uniref:hypothetical protein n=1 Tax=uncultured Draconibacterium sp. TaxID=1573823 RepID=UPI0032162386